LEADDGDSKAHQADKRSNSDAQVSNAPFNPASALEEEAVVVAAAAAVVAAANPKEQLKAGGGDIRIQQAQQVELGAAAVDASSKALPAVAIKETPKTNTNKRTGGAQYNYKARWETRFKELLEFKSEHGHANVPITYKGNPFLAMWVMAQRKNLTREQISQLNEIGKS
jgi:hypothetical protein